MSESVFFPRTRIKVCGITREEDAVIAGNAGVDAIGLVFYAKSPRYVSLQQAQRIVQATPPFVSVVALFKDARAEQIEEVTSSLRVDLLQFHGDECPADCNVFRLPYIKAVGMQGLLDYRRYTDSYPDAAGFLLDSHTTGEAGGTGKTFDWSRMPSDCDRPMILAGGLKPENVGRAILATRPYGIDLSSGVESAPGIKDPVRIHALIEEVRKVDCDQTH
jgi:phosphoribosylanthranilate isomerase